MLKKILAIAGVIFGGLCLLFIITGGDWIGMIALVIVFALAVWFMWSIAYLINHWNGK